MVQHSPKILAREKKQNPTITTKLERNTGERDAFVYDVVWYDVEWCAVYLCMCVFVFVNITGIHVCVTLKTI